jgi:hypothetical protein
MTNLAPFLLEACTLGTLAFLAAVSSSLGRILAPLPVRRQLRRSIRE